MNRREVLKGALMGAVALLSAPVVFGAATVAPAPLTIDQILGASWAAVLRGMRDGRPFVTPELNKAHDGGVITFSTLADMAKSPNYKVIQAPMWWTPEDEQRQKTAEQRISLCAMMLENLFNSHDFLIEQELLGKPLVVARDLVYVLDRGYQYPNVDGTFRKLYTGIVTEVPAHAFSWPVDED